MSSSNGCFLTCIQISEEAAQLVWYSHLFKNFPQFVVIHTVKGFRIVNKAEVDVFFWNSLIFLMTQWMLAIWSLVSLSFLSPACTSGSSWFMYCWSLAWRILSITMNKASGGDGIPVELFQILKEDAMKVLHSICIHKIENSKKKIYFCFIDYTKAFNCVDHNKLWKILKEMGIPD